MTVSIQNGAMPDRSNQVAVAGLVALAVAMGIGRFAFTPILPMMQADAGLSVVQGGWLASANYVGYLAGGLSAVALGIPVARAIRLALVAVAVSTLAMGLTSSLPAGLVLRFVAGPERFSGCRAHRNGSTGWGSGWRCFGRRAV